MPTGRHNLIALGATYFTRDGTSAGIPCKTEVKGLDVLKMERTGQTILALDGTAYTQAYSVKGVPLSFSVFRMTSALLNTVSDAIRAAVTNSTNLTLTITDGAVGSFYLTVAPLFPQPISFLGEFQSDQVYDVNFNFVVVALNYQMTATAGSLTLTGASATLTQG